jgi:hypothetical protein
MRNILVCPMMWGDPRVGLLNILKTESGRRSEDGWN